MKISCAGIIAGQFYMGLQRTPRPDMIGHAALASHYETLHTPGCAGSIGHDWLRWGSSEYSGVGTVITRRELAAAAISHRSEN